MRKIAVLLLISLMASTICFAEEEVTEERLTFQYGDFEYYINDGGVQK